MMLKKTLKPKRLAIWIMILLIAALALLMPGGSSLLASIGNPEESVGLESGEKLPIADQSSNVSSTSGKEPDRDTQLSQESSVPANGNTTGEGNLNPGTQTPFEHIRNDSLRAQLASPISCLYFDEPSFLNAISSAILFDNNINGLQGGIVPHHLLASSMIASFWKTASQNEYDLIVIIGPDHNKKGNSKITTITSGFSTIYGDVVANRTITDTLIAENLITEDRAVMETDHSISSHIPFIKYYMPEAEVVPLLVYGNCGVQRIKTLSEMMLTLTQGMNVLFVASMDFSHYLPLEIANEMDAYTEKVLADFDYDSITKMTNDNLDSRPSALFLLNTMASLKSKTMLKWDHSNSDIISIARTGYTTSYFTFGFFDELLRERVSGEGEIQQTLERGEIQATPDDEGMQGADDGEKVQEGSENKKLQEGFENKKLQEDNEEPNTAETRIIAVGDIMLGRGVAENLRLQGLGFTHPFTGVRGNLVRGDIVFGNLEHPMTDREESLDSRFKYILKSNTDAIRGLTYAGFNLFSIANNHIMDYYEGGLTDTIKTLRENSIAFAGAGLNLNEARKPAIIEKDGITVGLLAYTDMADALHPGNPSIRYAAGEHQSGVAPLRPAMIEADIQNARQQVDILVISLHWGVEESYGVTSEQNRLAHSLCDLGADIILGHHSHRFQGIEIYRGKPIAYSLGNFIFDQVPENQESFILDITYSGNKLTALKAIPVRTVNQIQVVPQKGAVAESMLERQRTLSLALGTECSIEGDCLIYK